MTVISIIVPTISGREESLETMVAHYRTRTSGYEFEIITPKDFACWPAGCNAGQLLATGDVLHFGADDLEPCEGWADAMVSCLEAGEVPAAQVWNYSQDGQDAYASSDGPAGAVTAFSRVPALTAEMARAVGPWPIMDYYADNWVSDKARSLGIETRVTEGYAFVHHWHPVGRLDDGDWPSRSLPIYRAELAKL